VSGGKTRYWHYFLRRDGQPDPGVLWGTVGHHEPDLQRSAGVSRTVPGAARGYNTCLHSDHLGSTRVKARDTGAEIAGSRTFFHGRIAPAVAH
jgi:hypothetical protein